MEKKLRILYVIDSLGAGGAEKSTAVLADFLWEQNIYFEILCLYNRKVGVQEELQNKGYPIFFTRSSNFFQQVKEISDKVKQGNFTLVHSILFKSNLRTRLAKSFTGFVHLESLVSTSYSKSRYEDERVNNSVLRLYQEIDRMSAKKYVNFFHSISDTVKQHYIEKIGIPENKIRVIYRGREPITKKAQTRNCASSDFIIVNFGRNEFAKGQNVLLKAACELRKLGYNFVIKIYGRPGELTADLKKYISENKLEEQVRLEGFSSNPQEALLNADLFVFPSLYEGLGGSLIEAMAAGLPVACNDLPVFHEIVSPNRNAKLFNINNIQTVVRAIQFFIDNPEGKKTFGNESLKIFNSRFLLSENHKKMLKLYKELC